ncbi:hypothetical protein HBB16_14840 [Pseudonocardia sp. MCCB 268]|nr:hypothetical protein [Pseudonocardia cytotoxica]
MSTMYRLKAYFGMVPGRRDGLCGRTDRYRGAPSSSPARVVTAGPPAEGAKPTRPALRRRPLRRFPAATTTAGQPARPAREPARPARAVRQNPAVSGSRRTPRRPRRRPRHRQQRRTGRRGRSRWTRTPSGASANPSARSVGLAPAPAPVPEQRTAAGPASITTLPRSYTEGHVGERYREVLPRHRMNPHGSRRRDGETL